MAPRGIDLELMYTFSTGRFVPFVVERLIGEVLCANEAWDGWEGDGVESWIVKARTDRRLVAGGRLWLIDQTRAPYWIELERADARTTRWRLMFDAEADGWTEKHARTCIEAASSGEEIPWIWRYSGESSNAPFACACCGYLTCDEPFGVYEICPVCDWKQDPSQSADPTMECGANRPSIEALQREAERWSPAEFERDPTWRAFSRTEQQWERSALSPLYWRRW